jgi:hypothetical protein
VYSPRFSIIDKGAGLTIRFCRFGASGVHDGFLLKRQREGCG